MTDLSRERIAELRASRKPLTWGELLALLDAYEAQRPRPASTKPEARCRVLLRSTIAPTIWVPGEHWPQYDSRQSYFFCSDRDGMLLDRNVIEWIPYPERADG